jgi:transcription antitermination factor NusG
MAKNRKQRRYFPARQGCVPIRLQRPRVEIDAGLAWFCVWTAARAEWQAQRDLEAAGYATYLPLVGLAITRRGKVVEIERNPVSRYLFVGLRMPSPDIEGVENALGMLFGWSIPTMPPRGSVLRVNHAPLRVPSGALQAYADECADGAAQGLAGGHLGLRAGDRARIVAGAFSGLEMTVDQLACDARVRGLVEMFGGRVSVEATADQLEAA